MARSSVANMDRPGRGHSKNIKGGRPCIQKGKPGQGATEGPCMVAELTLVARCGLQEMFRSSDVPARCAAESAAGRSLMLRIDVPCPVSWIWR